MVEKAAAAAPAPKAEKPALKDGKKLPAVPESVLKHRKRRDAKRTKLVQV